MAHAGVVVVGAGQAGYQIAASLRAEGYDAPITLIGAERGLPYQRPPLSKALLVGKTDAERTPLRPAVWYSDHRIELISDTEVEWIDRASQSIRTSTGTVISYDRLVLATGARNRELPVPGAMYLRTLDEALRVKERIATAETVAVLGGGFIGLEVAAAARALGKRVTLLESAPRLMARAVCSEVSEYFRETHESNGVRICLSASGEIPDTDVLVAGIGVRPNTELAERSGLTVGNGIRVDEYLRTDDPNIYAIGDCAEYPNPFAGGLARLESVQNAVDQALCVARAIVGKPEPYRAVPWFWTEQFDIRMQMAGIGQGADQIVARGNPASRKWSAFYFRGGRFVSADSINRPAEHLTVRKLLAAGVSPTVEQAADESFDLKSLLT